MEKSQLRKEIRERKRQFSSDKLAELSLSIIDCLLKHPKIIAAKTILMYYSLPDEVNTHEAINILTRHGKKVLLPVVIDNGLMEIRQYNGEEDLRTGAYGIKEPIGKLISDYSDIDVAVVPGMSFDVSCNRLGRGKGYYDRFLQQIPDIYKIGICFDFQKMKSIPTDKHDIRMNEIL